MGPLKSVRYKEMSTENYIEVYYRRLSLEVAAVLICIRDVKNEYVKNLI